LLCCSTEPIIRAKEVVQLLSKLRGEFVKESATALELLIATGLARKVGGNTGADTNANTLSATDGGFGKLGGDASVNYEDASAVGSAGGGGEDGANVLPATEGEGAGESDGNWDMSVMQKLMDYEDFTLAVCRVIVSDLWIGKMATVPMLNSLGGTKSSMYMLESSKSMPSPSRDRQTDDEGDIDNNEPMLLSAKQRITNGLSAWLHSYESKSLPL
jgi:hypothetical protein